MRDLDLHRRLAVHAASAADLRELAGWPIARRAAYLGALLPLARNGDPEIRAAAVRALAGARGVDGVRALVDALSDGEPSVTTAAVEGLRALARDAPVRYAHALYHPRPDIRRAALAGELPHPVAKLGIYLRADPASAELAARLPWPDNALPIAIELFRAGAATGEEIAELVARTTADELRQVLWQEHHREAGVVDAYLDAPAAAPPTGTDVLDAIVAALAQAPAPQGALDHLIAITTANGMRLLARRVAAALLGELAGERTAARPEPARRALLLAAAVVAEPSVILHPAFEPDHAGAVAAALARHRWPIRPSDVQIERILAVPAIRDDLALAAAVAGLFSGRRLARLAEALGEDVLLDRLAASDHGWDEIVKLPRERPDLERQWLARIEKRDSERYIALASRALAIHAGPRLREHLEQLPHRHLRRVYAAALAGCAGASDPHLAQVTRAIAVRIDRPTLVAIIEDVLDAIARPAAEHEHPLGARELLALIGAMPARLLHDAAGALSDPRALRLVAAIGSADTLPRDHELALTQAFATRSPPGLAAWCRTVARRAPVATSTLRPIRPRRPLSAAERAAITAASDHQLAVALAPACAASVTGLVGPLDLRPPKPNLAACVALLGCADPIEDVARTLDRFSEPSAKFDAALDDAACAWGHDPTLPQLVHARLWRWESHTRVTVAWIADAGGSLASLHTADALPGRLARDTLWRGISEALMFMRYRHVDQFRAEATLELARYVALRVDTDIGCHAARVLVALIESGCVPVVAVREVVLDRVADASPAAREYLARIVRLVGVPAPPPPAPPPPAPLVERIRTCRDLDQLAAWCADPRPAIVQEAALALVVLGADGQLRLARALGDAASARDSAGVTSAALPAPIPILASILLWDHPPALAMVRALASPALPPVWQFHLHMSLVARGEPGALAAALAAVRAPAGTWHFRRDDWDALVRVADVVTCAVALADAPHHHAYQRALQILLSLERPTPEVRAALVRFLEADADRPLHLRVSAARYLAQHWQDATGLPLLVEYIADERADDWPFTLELVPPAALPEVARTIVSAALIGGDAACSEKRMWQIASRLRESGRVAPEVLDELDVRILETGATAAVRRAAAAHAIPRAQADDRLRAVAEIFAWGVRRGVELAGRMFRFRLTSKERELGYTDLAGSHVYVSALPLLRGEPHGRAVVEGLVLHELGHHVYHAGEAARAIWAKAHREGIGHFLNLIADEHLERNLRALDPAFGDRLKRLGAYAFQHAAQEIGLAFLLQALRASAAPALIAADLEVAFDESSVRVRRGAILGELDRRGHPVARFSRALRLGLGNRSGDPLVARALAAVGKDLRMLDMQGLYDLTRRLVELFGGAVQIACVFGGPEGLAFGERDGDVFGAGIDDEILQREVERILDPRQARSSGPPRRGDRLALNVNPSVQFDRITHVVRVRGEPDAHRRLAASVHRHALRLRRFLDDLGLRMEPARARTQGRALDRARLRSLVTRGDPRILIARTPVRRTDLFLATLVDCSGSMQAGDNLERARRFAVVVAEAVRALPGVEARFFGFTDRTIYDAGDAVDCGVAALAAGGGNNDAAALYHAAAVAHASRKRAKVIVMISDGLPTECSVAALAELVTLLTKRRSIVCAQVAVRRLDEICFPHHVVLDDRELDAAVARFGRTIADLARRSLA